MAICIGFCGLLQAQERVGKSPWGTEDEIGTLNMMTTASQLKALQSTTGTRVYDLSVEYFIGMPSFNFFGDPAYQFWLTHTPQGTVVDNPNGAGKAMNQKVSYTSDAFSMLTHAGTHIDALSHFGLNGEIYNGYKVNEQLGDKGWHKGGAEKIPPIISRAVLIDVAAFKGKSTLDPNYMITVDDLKGALSKQQVSIKKGDIVLIRTGQGAYFQNASQYLNQFPGLSLAAAKWLAEDQQIMLLGADNLGLEAFPSEEPGNWVPVHTYLLAQRGVSFIENLNLEELAADSVYEFAFIATPLKLKGASGAPLRPIAIPIR